MMMGDECESDAGVEGARKEIPHGQSEGQEDKRLNATLSFWRGFSQTNG